MTSVLEVCMWQSVGVSRTIFSLLPKSQAIHWNIKTAKTLSPAPAHFHLSSSFFCRHSQFHRSALIFDSATMAFRSPTYLKSMVTHLRGRASNFTTSTTPKMKTYSPPINFGNAAEAKPKAQLGNFVPVYVAVGMIMLSASFGVHTAMHQLKRNPGVSVKKSRRETIPELVEPEKTLEQTDHFIKDSFFRKVAHIQEPTEVIGNPIRGSPLAREPRAETLKSVGVDPAAV